MTVRFKLAATIVATGFITLLAVVACVLYAFMRFEHETTFQRANAFLERVTAYDPEQDQVIDIDEVSESCDDDRQGRGTLRCPVGDHAPIVRVIRCI